MKLVLKAAWKDSQTLLVLTVQSLPLLAHISGENLAESPMQVPCTYTAYFIAGLFVRCPFLTAGPFVHFVNNQMTLFPQTGTVREKTHM